MALNAAQLSALNLLLDQMMALPAADRGAWIDALHLDDAALAPALRDLLNQPGMLDEGTLRADWSWPLRAAIVDTVVASSAWRAGVTVGPYQLLRLLGEGGMGMVWLAQRSDGAMRRQVALKLPRPGLQRWHLDERFARERDILASLEHPHIARLYDAGVAADGQPYLAMEYVEGRSITQFADEAALDVHARLRLFTQVLGAVQHAHQRLIVHRDLKPSNILVDTTGSVRLLDFGIALLQDERAPQPALTEIGQALLTPQYASPEQLLHEPVSTATDIYSLGVVLCQLLSGQSPHAPTRTTRAALEEAILYGEPQRLSRLAPAALTAQLRGDLDNIVLKALRRAPVERYVSADAFAQDIQRHLDGAPVAAHPSSLGYRVRKFAARNRLAVFATCAVAVALVIGIGIALWQAGLARTAAAQAQREAQRARAVQDFLVDMFNEADPAKAKGRDVTVRDLMAHGERELQTRLRREPASAAAVRGAMVDIYQKLGDEQRALPLAEVQVQQARARHANNVDLAFALLALGNVQAGLNQDTPAFANFQEARALLAPVRAAYPTQWLDLSVALASTLNGRRRNAAALALLEGTVADVARQLGSDNWQLGRARIELGMTYSMLGRHDEAAAQFARLEPLLEHAGDAHATEAADAYSNIGFAMSLAGRYDDAERLLRRAAAEFDRLEGKHNSQSIYVTSALIAVLYSRGDYRGAQVAATDNARRAADFFGASAGESLALESFRVKPLLMLGQRELALAVARRTFAAITSDPRVEPARKAASEHRLMLALLFNGLPQEALQHAQHVLKDENLLRESNDTKAMTRFYASAALRMAGRPLEAAAFAADAAQRWRNDPAPPARVKVAKAMLAQAAALAAAGQHAAAAARLTDAEVLLRANSPVGNPDLLTLDVVRAGVWYKAGRKQAATELNARTRAALNARMGVQLPVELPLIP